MALAVAVVAVVVLSAILRMTIFPSTFALFL
jgi:hypothetical protein